MNNLESRALHHTNNDPLTNQYTTGIVGCKGESLVKKCNSRHVSKPLDCDEDVVGQYVQSCDNS
jgi:hypothetical protein